MIKATERLRFGSRIDEVVDIYEDVDDYKEFLANASMAILESSSEIKNQFFDLHDGELALVDAYCGNFLGAVSFEDGE